MHSRICQRETLRLRTRSRKRGGRILQKGQTKHEAAKWPRLLAEASFNRAARGLAAVAPAVVAAAGAAAAL